MIPPSRPSFAVGSAQDTTAQVCSRTAVVCMFGGQVRLGGVLSPDTNIQCIRYLYHCKKGPSFY